MIGKLAVALAALAVGGCTIVNTTDACDGAPHEVRVNRRGDDVEHIGSSRGAALLADGRTLVAHVSSAEDGTRSEVRFSILEKSSGTANILCDGDAQERTLSEDGTLGFHATAAAVDIPDPSNPVGHVAVAAVGWTSLPDRDGDPSVWIQLLDDGGCDVGPAFPPVLVEQTGPVQGLALAWSEARGALYAIFHDGRHVMGAWLEAPGSTSTAETLATEESVIGDLAVAIGPDGRGLVAWEYTTLAWLGEGQVGVHAALLDEDGHAAAPFRADEGPSFYYRGHVVALTVAVDVHEGGSALAYETSVDGDEPPRVHVLELDAGGAPRHGGPRDVDAGGGGADASPSLRYLADGSLLALWESAANDGTMARLYDEDGGSRFTGVACDEGAFAIGSRDALLPGSSTAVVSGHDLWIFHAGDSADDPVGTAALGWHVPLSSLWPGESLR